VNAIHPFVLPAKALDISQVQGAQAKTPVAVVVAQAHGHEKQWDAIK
jgi:hypothetical protein